MQKRLSVRGALCRALPVSRLPQLKADIQEHLDSGALSPELVKPIRSLQQFAAPDWAAGGSIAIAAAPSSRSVLVLSANGKRVEAAIPPTYVSAAARDLGRKALEEATGRRAEWAFLPVKTVAARTGLARFGRNNVAYVEGMGSCARLDAYYTEADLGLDHWQEREALPQCARCRLCLEACPTGAIRSDRFVIDALRCLTHINEHQGPFPDWVKTRWHNAAIGCLACQEVCPVNKPYLAKVEKRVELSEEETGLVLKGGEFEQLPAALQGKLKSLEVEEYYGVLPRNLGALVGEEPFPGFPFSRE